MTIQIADVTRLLASADRITAKGHRIVLDDEHAHILHKATGRKVNLHKKGNAFVMHVRIRPEQGKPKDDRMDIGAMHASGFTRQECECDPSVCIILGDFISPRSVPRFACRRRISAACRRKLG